MQYEIINVGNPKRNNTLRRTSYYTSMSILLNDTKELVIAKVDTGASFTVIGFDAIQDKNIRQLISKSDIDATASDASGSVLTLKGLVVDSFEFAKGVVLNNTLIYFSEQMHDRSVLGMDILSLFDFHYRKEVHETRGTFWLYNVEDTLARISEKMYKSSIPYLNPGEIFDIDIQEKEDTLQGIIAGIV